MKIVLGCFLTARSRLSISSLCPSMPGLHFDHPGVAVHQAVIGPVHRLVRPDGVRNVDIDRHPQLCAFVPDGIDARIVRMRDRRGRWAAERSRFPSRKIRLAPPGSPTPARPRAPRPAAAGRREAPAFIAQFSHSQGAQTMALFQCLGGIRPKPRLVARRPNRSCTTDRNGPDT